MVRVYVYLMVRVSVGEGSLYFHGTIAYMVGAAVYGWGKVGRGKVGPGKVGWTNDDQTKDVVRIRSQ